MYAYVDTPRSSSPTTFMSNMLYACSIMYKTRLPFVVCFNKTDITPADFASEWMSDYEALQDALAADDKYISTLTRSMALVLVISQPKPYIVSVGYTIIPPFFKTSTTWSIAL